MQPAFQTIRTSIRVNVVALCLIATLLTAGLATGLQYYFGQSLARQAASDLYTTVAASITQKLRGVAQVNANVIDLLADNPSLRDPEHEDELLAVFSRILAKNPLYYGVYLGRSDGSFFEVINLATSKQARESLGALPEDAWVIITVRRGDSGWERHYQYLDINLATRLSRSESTNYEVRSRPWYSSAVESDNVQISAPYRFAQLGIPGRTISKRADQRGTVVAIDMTLSTVSAFLADQSISERSVVYLYDQDGSVIVSSNGKAGPSPVKLLRNIAVDTTAHEQLQEQNLWGHPHLVYSAETSSLDDKPLFVGIVSPVDEIMAPFLDKVQLSILVTTGLLLLLLPFSWIIANPIVRPIKQLANENDKVRRREFDSVQRVNTRVQELDELSGSMVDMVNAIQAYELSQRKLMDAIIELIAQAIDDKSAYTGGHCERVPELALLLARHASVSEEPAFREFRLETEDEWREYRIAAWLHDCGKITTPEHVVDKGSKLELIYNRIHEIRMRFEVLWRDAQLDYWQALHRDPGSETSLKAALDEKWETLVDDFAFVAQCNVGGEFLDEDKLQRLQDIAATTWLRYFDNRLGLSPVEELKIPPGAAELPATENLLADKAEHLIERTRSTEYPAELGIDMDIPPYLHNQGEIYNLSISRGTLTAEDRFRINEHMISTIKMLESLPFPEELKNVPRYASTHHETMKGSGYPRRLSGDQLSIPERMLAVADVFEALTASDRPYKKAKTVSEAVRILHQMVLDNHIDRDCFELFLRSGAYLEYAQKFLGPEQRDLLDISVYLRGG